MGGFEQSLFEVAEPAGHDRSGSLERLAGTPARLLKRFQLPAWRSAEGQWLLRQRLWRVARLGLPELPGLTLGDGATCTLEDHTGPTLLAAPPLTTETLVELLGQLATLMWRAHQARVTGLRFCTETLARTATGWRWLAPDLAPAEQHEEAERAADLEALAQFVEDLLDAPLEADAPLARAIALMHDAQFQPTAALAQVLEILGLPTPPQRLPAEEPRAHRQWELDDLALRLEMALEDTCLQVATVVAPREAGSRSFVRALAERFRGSGTRLQAVSCRLPGAPMAAWATVARRLLATRSPDLALGPELAPLAQLLPEFSADPLPPLPPRLSRLRLFRALRTLLCEAQDTPPCLVLTDFEAADELTRGFVTYLRGLREGLPLLLCLVSIEDVSAWGEEDTLQLAPLAREQADTLVQSWCITKPMSLDALEKAWRYAGASPARLQRLCLRWLQGVPFESAIEAQPEALCVLLGTLACLGGEAEIDTLARATGAAETDFFARVDDGLAAGWLEQSGASIGFLLPQEAHDVYLGLEAAPVHKRLAANLLPSARWLAAHHALEGHDEKLLGQLALDTGVAFLNIGAYDWSAPLLLAGLGLLPADDPARAAFASTLGTLYLERGEPARANAIIKQALRESPQARHVQLVAARVAIALDDTEVAEAIYRDFLASDEDELQLHGALGLSTLALARGDLSESLAQAERTLALANRRDATVLQAEANWLIGRVLLSHGGPSLAQCFVYLSEALRIAEECEHLDLSARASGALGEACLRIGRMSDAQAALHRHLELCVLLDLTEESLIAVVTLAGTMLQMGFFDAALAEVTGIESELIESERQGLWAEAIAIRAAALAVLGYLNDPLRLLDQSLRTARRLRDEALELRVLGYLAVVLSFMGKYGRAEEIAQTALPIAIKLGQTAAEWAQRLLLSEIRAQTGAWGEAEAMLIALRQEAREQGASGVEAFALRGLSGVLAAKGDWPQAERLAAEALDYAELNSHLLLQGELYRVLGAAALARHDGEVARNAFDSALSAADAMNSPHHRALAYAALSRCAPDTGDMQAMRAHATESLGIYLDQLTEHGKRDFLQAPERREILDPDQSVDTTPLPSLLNLLQNGAESGVPTASFSVLDQVLGLLTEHLPLEELLPRVNETFMRLSQATRGMIYLLNEDGELRLHDRQNAPESGTLGAEACLAALEQVEKSARTLWVPDTETDPTFEALPEVRTHALRGLLCVPLKVPDGDRERVLGCLYGDRQAPWIGISDQEIALVEMMARYTSVMIEVGLLQADTQRKSHRLKMLNQFSQALAGTLDIDKLLHLALRQILQITHGEQG
ncbi:MAG TPA: GAF domain-containing protein, partial [Oscillatoriaceae cyanobacterium]